MRQKEGSMVCSKAGANPALVSGVGKKNCKGFPDRATEGYRYFRAWDPAPRR